jgi:hypothetical protein
MVSHVALRRGGSWRFFVLLAFALSAFLVNTSSAAAVSGPGHSPVAQVKHAAPAAGTITPAVACPFFNICAYPQPNFGGNPVDAINCGQNVPMPFVGVGSWINNQTAGTRAFFRDSGGGVILTTAGAHSQLAHFDWTDIFNIQAC